MDRYGDDLASIPVQFRSFGRKSRFAGPAVTLKCFEDNALLKPTLAEHPDPSGKVLVVDGGGSLRSALVGDLIAGIAVQRGWAGLIIWGAVRDSVAPRPARPGNQGLGNQPQKSSKTGHGVVNGPIEIGGVWIAPRQTVHSRRGRHRRRGSHSARRRAASPATCPSSTAPRRWRRGRRRDELRHLVSYSITVRLEIPAGGKAVSQLTTAVESAGGSVTALDVTASGHDRLRMDVTIAARDTDHADLLVEAMRSVPGAVIGKVSDRTFLMHLGGKIEMAAKHPIHNRDDLAMLYTPGVAPRQHGDRQEPSRRPPTHHQTQQRGRHH